MIITKRFYFYFPLLLLGLSSNLMVAQVENQDAPPVLVEQEPAPSVSDLLLIPPYKREQRNGKYGFVNKNGQIVIPCDYDYLPDGIMTFMSAVKDKKAGVINHRNDILIPFQFDVISPIGISWGPPYIKGIPKVNINNSVRLMAKKGGKAGLINMYGETMVDFQYDHIESFFGKYLVRKNDKKGAIYPNGEIVIPIKYDQLTVTKGWTRYSTELDGKQGLYSFPENQALIPPIYDQIIEEKPYFMVKMDDLWGLLHASDFTIAMQPQYRSMRHIKRGQYLVSQGNKKGIINAQNEVIVPLVYQDIQNLDKDHYRFTSDELVGIMDLKGKIIVPAQYKSIVKGYDMYLIQMPEGKFGLVTLNNKVLLAPEFDQIKFVAQGMFALQKNDRWAIADNTGALISDYLFQTIDKYGYPSAITPEGKKMVIGTKNGADFDFTLYDDIEFLRKTGVIRTVQMNADTKTKKYGLIYLGQKLLDPVFTRITTDDLTAKIRSLPAGVKKDNNYFKEYIAVAVDTDSNTYLIHRKGGKYMIVD